MNFEHLNVFLEIFVVQPLSCVRHLATPWTAARQMFEHLPELAQTQVHRVGDAITISSSVVPFSSCPQSFPASGSFPMSWLFTSGDQSKYTNKCIYVTNHVEEYSFKTPHTVSECSVWRSTPSVSPSAMYLFSMSSEQEGWVTQEGARQKLVSLMT